MGVDIIRGTSQKRVASTKLADRIPSLPVNGILYIGHPIIGTPEGAHTVDALLASKEKGLIVFDLIEGANGGDYCSRQDDSANRLESLLKTHRELMERRKILIPIHTISFAPAISERNLPREENSYVIANSDSLPEKLNSLEPWSDQDEEIYRKLLSVLQNVSTIRKGIRRRIAEKSDSRGKILQELEDSIATLDYEQNRAVIETVDGIQRIRGLAGSGKTIVLALKAAYLHINNPDWRIAVTFQTRSLKGHFRRLITRFTLARAHEEPDWNNLRILNAWGASGTDRDGIYHEFCRAHGLEYFDFNMAKKFGQGKEFSGACADALRNCKEFKSIYDVILVDEAQDLPPEFLRICYKVLREKKMLIYAYDELQNLSTESLPPPENIFGTDSNGHPVVTFDESSGNDIILKKCYRNSKPVLTTAHALGFGIYRNPVGQERSGLVQMFDDPQFWKEVGYSVEGGRLSLGKQVTLQRTSDTSPEFLENHSRVEDLIKFICFNNQQEQTEWLVNEIKKNLENEELMHEDIVVINPDPRTTRTNVGAVRSRLLEMGISNHIAGIDTSPDVFKSERSITFTGIHRAKGNEAGMVYIINAEECYSGMQTGLDLARVRNQLFTAITRSKAWVRVLGIGKKMDELKMEYDRLCSKNFQLEFRYPTEEEIDNLRVVHRDAPRKDIEKSEDFLSEIVDDIQSGKYHLDDLDENIVRRFKELYGASE